MDHAAKVCPHCKVALHQRQEALELVKRGTGSTDHTPGLPVALYSCPVCGYIELYDLRVIGRI